MMRKPILEPKDVDLTLEGGDLSATDLKTFRAMLRKSQVEIVAVQERAAKQPWIDDPVPTLQQLVALQHKQQEAQESTRDPLPKGTIDMDESGIGGSPSPQESAYVSAYIWSSQPTTKRYQDIGQTITMAQEPDPARWTKVRPKTKSKKP
ncbi:MAG: hypothetical protein IPP83_15365 [Flavobacteriales bacterium]|nr:hypothetical protein [Flavobacteriales bacterium]